MRKSLFVSCVRCSENCASFLCPDDSLSIPTSLSRHGWIGVLVCVVEGLHVACVGCRADCFISGALAVVRKMAAAMYALVNQAVIQSDPPLKRGDHFA